MARVLRTAAMCLAVSCVLPLAGAVADNEEATRDASDTLRALAQADLTVPRAALVRDREGWRVEGGGPRAAVAAPEPPAAIAAPPAAALPGLPDRSAATVSAVVLAGSLGIPASVLAAYQAAAGRLAKDDPSCGLRWEILAGIGRIESGHARGGRVDANGTAVRIIGPALDGSPGVAAIRDSDGGQWDDDTVWDHAVGPMQFLPGTWRGFGADGSGDGVADPHNVKDAALAAGRYLCAGDVTLATPAGLAGGLLRYNRSIAYVANVMRWIQAYSTGTVVPTVGSTGGGSPTTRPPGPLFIATTPVPMPSRTAPVPTPAATTPTPLPTETTPTPDPTETTPTPDPTETTPTPDPTETTPTPDPTETTPTPDPTETTPTPEPSPTETTPTPEPSPTETSPSPTPTESGTASTPTASEPAPTESSSGEPPTATSPTDATTAP